ncbi:uncharacterized protein LOC144168235 [Haemaphysalis longicornis]
MLSLMAPSRSTDVDNITFSALVASCVANYLTACTVAGRALDCPGGQPMGRRKKRKGKAHVERQDPYTADQSPAKLQRPASSKKSTSSAAVVAHSDVVGNSVTVAPSDTVAGVASVGSTEPSPTTSRESPAPRTPELPAVENTGPPQPSIPAAAPESSPTFKYASPWDAATPDTDPATPVAIRKPGLQHDSGSPARAATSTCTAGASATREADGRNTAVVPNTGGPLPNEAIAKIYRGTTSAHGFPESTRAGYERESSGGSMAHHSDLNSEVRGQLEALGAIKPTGSMGRQGPASGHLERLRSFLGWATWAMVHAYTGWIAWRFWVQHETLSLGSGSCTDPVLLVIMLIATLSYSAFLVLQITGLWAPLVDTLVVVGNVIGDAMNRYAFVKP